MGPPHVLRRVLDVCEEALAFSGPDRQRFLTEACADHPSLLASVESVLRAIEQTDAFLGERLPDPPEVTIDRFATSTR